MLIRFEAAPLYGARHRGCEYPEPARQVDAVKRAIDRALLRRRLLAARPAHERVRDDHHGFSHTPSARRQIAALVRASTSVDQPPLLHGTRVPH